MWKAIYVDGRKNFEFYSSKGANLIYDVAFKLKSILNKNKMAIV